LLLGAMAEDLLHNSCEVTVRRSEISAAAPPPDRSSAESPFASTGSNRCLVSRRGARHFSKACRAFIYLTAVAALTIIPALAWCDEVVVSAAVSLSNAFKELGKDFEREHAGMKVAFNFGASGQLLQQIANGAPVDVFASADQETMDQAESRQLIVGGTRF